MMARASSGLSQTQRITYLAFHLEHRVVQLGQLAWHIVLKILLLIGDPLFGRFLQAGRRVLVLRLENGDLLRRPAASGVHGLLDDVPVLHLVIGFKNAVRHSGQIVFKGHAAFQVVRELLHIDSRIGIPAAGQRQQQDAREAKERQFFH